MSYSVQLRKEARQSSNPKVKVSFQRKVQGLGLCESIESVWKVHQGRDENSYNPQHQDQLIIKLAFEHYVHMMSFRS